MRINRKGFMLAEVVVVSVIVCVCLVTLATGIARVSKAYDTRNRYYDVNALYMAEKANLYLIEDGNINNLINNGSSIKVNNDNLNNIISFYKSADSGSTTNIYFSKYALIFSMSASSDSHIFVKVSKSKFSKVFISRFIGVNWIFSLFLKTISFSVFGVSLH